MVGGSPWIDMGYWLSRCEGFTVVCGERRLGRVVGVRYGARVDRPDAIVVVARLARRPFEVAASSVVSVSPDDQRIEVAATVGEEAPHPLAEELRRAVHDALVRVRPTRRSDAG